MATTVNMHEAKTHLSRLVERAEQGEETIIARAGKPAARLVPLAVEQPKKRRLGLLEGQFNVPDDFDTIYQAEIEEMFYGNPDKFNR
jgi:prevent-host-death family protein